MRVNGSQRHGNTKYCRGSPCLAWSAYSRPSCPRRERVSYLHSAILYFHDVLSAMGSAADWYVPAQDPRRLRELDAYM